MWCQLLGCSSLSSLLSYRNFLLPAFLPVHILAQVFIGAGRPCVLISLQASLPPLHSVYRVNMPIVISPVPEIAISLASPEEPTAEPFSPFSECTFLSDDSDSFRPTLLSPPPPSSITPKQLSPLRPKDAPVTGKGLERERFEALLQASRERNAALGSKKPTTDLRKEIALKVHKSKQSE